MWVPINEFGQRDHLLLILAFPYFLLILARVEAWTVSYKSAVFIGFLAGSVFLFKPYFLLTLFLLESFLFLKKRHVTSFMRPELFTMFGLAIFYFILLLKAQMFMQRRMVMRIQD